MLLINDIRRQNHAIAADIQAAIHGVFERAWYILGPEVEAFEREFAEYCGVEHCAGVGNGTDALELALRALDLPAGSRVLTVANAGGYASTAILAGGHTPVYADVDPATMTMRPVSAADVQAVIVTHLYGRMAAMPEILTAAGNVPVIEDCAQAHGAEIGGESVGSFGDAAAFSFCQDKIISTGGEGGLLTVKDDEAWNWAWSFKDHGKDFAKSTTPADGDSGMFRWVHDRVGTNWRLTAPQAAIGRLQLSKLDDWLAARARNAAIWAEALSGIAGVRVPLPDGNSRRHAYYKLYFYVDGGTDEEAAGTRSEIIRRSAAAGLRVFSGSCSEIYLEKAFDGLPHADCPVSRSLGARSLMVEVHPTLRPELLKLRAQLLADIVGSVLGSR